MVIALYAVPSDTLKSFAIFLTDIFCPTARDSIYASYNVIETVKTNEVIEMTKHEQILAYIESLAVGQKMTL
jgi:cephalosporin-C deacetylase-like acetyl esterase